MKEAVDACSRELQRLGRDYYHQQLSREEYLAQRKKLLDQLEMEFARNTETRVGAPVPDQSKVPAG